jgi:hypothetical protein
MHTDRDARSRADQSNTDGTRRSTTRDQNHSVEGRHGCERDSVKRPVSLECRQSRASSCALPWLVGEPAPGTARRHTRFPRPGPSTSQRDDGDRRPRTNPENGRRFKALWRDLRAPAAAPRPRLGDATRVSGVPGASRWTALRPPWPSCNKRRTCTRGWSGCASRSRAWHRDSGNSDHARKRRLARGAAA